MPADASGDRRSCTGFDLMPAGFRSPILPLTLSASRSPVARDTTRDWEETPIVVHRPFRLVACDPMASPQSVDTMNDLRVRVIETVMAAVTIAQYRAAAALAVGNQAEADRFETEVREAEQRLARLRGLHDQLWLPRYDYLS
jgi:hypothetical protein